MQEINLPTHSERVEFTDIDGDGGVTVARTRDYVKVNTWGGHAGPLGCMTNLSPEAADSLGRALLKLAHEAAIAGVHGTVHA